MKQHLRQKLESQQGASIIMALFLFMVCAALAAVILSASTAAAGRAAGLAKGDQQYYNVTSAAELMRDMMGGDQGVSVQVECTKTTVLKRSGGTMTPESENYSVAVTGVGESGATGLFKELAEKLVVAQAGTDSSDVWDWQFGSGSSEPATYKLDYSYAITGQNASDALNVLQKVQATATMESSGNIVMRFTMAGSAPAYAMNLICEAEGKTEASTNTQTSGGTITRNETKTTTITWKAAKLKSEVTA